MVTVASDNPFPSILMVEGDPEDLADDAAAGQRRLAVGTDHLLYLVDDAGVATEVGGGAAGAVATDAIWDAAGDLVQGTGANTAAKLSAGLVGQMLRSAGAAAANLWAYPPGYEFDYQAKTSNTSITATSEATANTVLTGATVTYDGSTIVNVQFSAFAINAPSGGANRQIIVVLYDSVAGGAAASIGLLGKNLTGATTTTEIAFYGFLRFTPTAATHQLSIRAYVTAGTGSVDAGAGGSGAAVPAAMRITKA